MNREEKLKKLKSQLRLKRKEFTEAEYELDMVQWKFDSLEREVKELRESIKKLKPKS